MALVPVGLQIEYFADPTKFGTVSGGLVYVGEPDTDPEILANRITVTLRQESGGDIPIAPAEQPFVTGPGGIILYNGSPASLLSDQAYSIKVNDSGGSQIYYVASSTGGGFVGIDDQATTAQVEIRDTYTRINNDVGINNVPNVAWGVNVGALQMGYAGAAWSANTAPNNLMATGANVYDNGVNPKYLFTAPASAHLQLDGAHIFYVAPSGPQDADISFVQTIVIANDGGVIIGSPTGGSLGPGTVNVENQIALGGNPITRIVGQETFWPTETPPTGWLIEDGSAISRTTYADLFAVIGTRYGIGDGSTTFNLPDPQGQTIRVVSGGSGVDPDAATRTDRGDGTTGNVVGTNQAAETLAHSHGAGTGNASAFGNTPPDTFAVMWPSSTGTNPSSIPNLVTGGNETRMVNTYRYMIIQY